MLNAVLRMASAFASISFGNLSRGNVPGILLSEILTELVGLPGAAGLYLTDAVATAWLPLELSLLVCVMPEVPRAKMLAQILASRGALTGPQEAARSREVPRLDRQRFAVEAWSITYGRHHQSHES